METTMNSKEAFALAKHNGRYRHFDSVVFQDKNGDWFCERYSKRAIKAAMLAVGTAGKFYVEGGRFANVVRWREAVTRFRNADFLTGHQQ